MARVLLPHLSRALECVCWSCLPTRSFAGELRPRANLRVHRLLGLGTQDFERMVKALPEVLNENTADLFHYLDLCSSLRSCHFSDLFVRRCVHTELFSCLNRVCGCSRDFGDHAGTALDSSLIQGRFRVTLNNSYWQIARLHFFRGTIAKRRVQPLLIVVPLDEFPLMLTPMSPNS